jgi:hypothetical protein
VNNWQYEKEVADYPDYILHADDDATWVEYGYEDDYVFFTPRTKTWISEYAVLYFAASLGFVLAGLIDWYLWRDALSSVMILAAAFGLASASVADRDDETTSIWLNFVSVHLWLGDALAVLAHQRRQQQQDRFWLLMGGGEGGGTTTISRRSPSQLQQQQQQQRQQLQQLQSWLRLANGCFVTGTFLDVMLSWFYVLRDPARVGLFLAGTEITAAGFWMVTATIYLAVSARLVLVAAGVAAAQTGSSMVQSATEETEPGEPSSSQTDTVFSPTRTVREKRYAEIFV